MRNFEESGATGHVETTCSTLVELLSARACDTAAGNGYAFLGNGETQTGRLSFADLDLRARAVAAKLQNLGLAGERAVLLYPPGLEYIEAFFGCLYAGVVAVPAYPPSRQHLPRLAAVIRDAAPAAFLTAGDLAAKFRDASFGDIAGPSIWLATDATASDEAAGWRPPTLAPESLAFLQYTSGSTGDPKGAMVSHANLLANQEAIRQRFGHSERSTVVGWLPLYHDMGLIGNVLQPLYIGADAVLMPPMAFLEKPARWLRAISKYRAATSGGPNFAYELCVRKISPEEKRGLDLSAWTLAFNGSEPVRASTLERFSEAFAECGFKRNSFFPCYGLAEATLFVAGSKLAAPDGNQEEKNLGTGQGELPRRVSCGLPADRHIVEIVDRDGGMPCPQGREGEIWVSGPSVAQGYWNRPEESETVFRAKLASDKSAAYLRTGDLGLVENGQLYITGRIKDLMIVRGRNYYPQDIEHALTRCSDALNPESCVAFSVTGENEELPIAVAELTRAAMRMTDYSAVFAAMRGALAEAGDLTSAELALVPPGGIPKTSSGKLRRQSCKRAYLEGTLPIVARAGDAAGPATPERPQASPRPSEFRLLRQALALIPPAQRPPLLVRFLKNRLASLLKTPESAVPDDVAIRALGLDSLKAVELKHAADDLLGVETPISLFLSDRSIAEIADMLADQFKGSQSEFAEERTETGEMPCGLTSTQLSMWTMQHMEPDSVIYNLHLALRIDGDIDAEALRRSFERMAQRHEILRTVYRTNGEEVFQSALPLSELPEIFGAVDASGRSEAELQEDMARRMREPFDLARGPVLRATLYRQDTLARNPESAPAGQETAASPGRAHTLLLCAHHIALDLWSILMLIDELGKIPAANENAQATGSIVPDTGYAAFAAWQRRYLASPASEADWDYWRRRLSGELPPLALPLDRPRAATRDFQGASLAVRLGRVETERLRSLARQNGGTLFALLLAAYKVLLHRHTRQNDSIVGVPTGGRGQARFASVAGNFVNPVPIRSHPAGNKPFSAYLAEVHEALLGALERQNYPFPLMVERLNVQRDAERWPIYQTLFVFQQAQTGVGGELAQLALGEDGDPIAIAGNWRARPVAIRRRIERFDFKLMAAEAGDGLLLSFQYRADLFEERTIARFAARFRKILDGVTENPAACIDALPLLDERERNLLLERAAGPARPLPADACIHRLFEAQAARTPALPAVACKNRRLTYGELNDVADRWAHRLSSLGAGPGKRVGICVERSSRFAIALLATLKSGAAYVPLDPAYPAERVARTLIDAGADILLTQTGLEASSRLPSVVRLDMDLWPAGPEPAGETPTRPVDPDGIAYVIYTSGSTGHAKGVAVSHRNLVNYALYMAERISAEAGLHYGLVSTPAADLGNTSLFVSLISGGCLHVFDQDTASDGRALADYVERQPMDVLKIVPSHLAALLDSADGRNIAPRRTLISGGDALTCDLVARLASTAPQCRVFNHYGPTETTIGALVFELPAGTPEKGESISVPIGQPIANAQAYILDENLEPVPPGVTGELYLGGAGVAQGYLNRPDLTAERFLPNPFAQPRLEGSEANFAAEWPSGDSGRLYRTGDLARRRENGPVEFLGRADHQLKIRGFRIEPGEIETCLRTRPDVRDVAVTAWEDERGVKRLAAYIVSDCAAPDAEILRGHAQNALPDYMVPAAFVFLDRLPLTANGKLDRKALPAPDPSNERQAGSYVAPRNETEAKLAEIWAETLKIERVGIHDNFFSLGGDSILSIQMASRARRVGLDLAPRQIFQRQTIAELALATKSAGSVLAEQGIVEGPAPLTPVQKRFFAQNLANPHHWNQSLLLETLRPFDPQAMERAAECLPLHHDALRLRFSRDGATWRACYAPKSRQPAFYREDLSGTADAALDAVIAERAADWQRRIDLTDGPTFAAVLFDLGEGRRSRLLLVIHHLAMDIASWRILLDDFVFLHERLASGQEAALPAKTTSYRQWALRLQERARTLSADDEPLARRPEAAEPAWPVDREDGTNREGDAAVYTVRLPETLTRALIQEASACYRASVQELLLAAVVQGLAERTGRRRLRVEVEAHSRDNGPFRDLDFARTVGRFTTSYPVAFEVDPTHAAGRLVKETKDQFRSQSARGFDRTARRWLGEDGDRGPDDIADAPVLFNYLGHLDLGTDAHAYFRQCALDPSIVRDPLNRRAHELAINASVGGGCLQMNWVYGAARYAETTPANWADAVAASLERLIAQRSEPGAAMLARSDFPLAKLTESELERLPYPPENVEDLYPLGPMQEGMLFYALMYPGSGIYHMIDRYEIDGDVDIGAFRTAWQEVLDRHPILRTSFLWKDYSSPHQCVQKRLALPFDYRDWRGMPAPEQERQFEAMIETELKTGFDFTVAPLMRIFLVRFGDRSYRFVRSHHHILMDAWCKSPVLLEFRANYEARAKGAALPPRETAIPYRDYIGWLARQDIEAAENFWRAYLSGFDEPTPLVVDLPVPPDANARSEVRDLVALLSEDDTRALQTLSQRWQLTPNSFLQAAWALMLAHYSRNDEIAFGVTVAGRPTDLPGVETALGLFINSLPLRVRLRPERPAIEFLRELLYRNLELRQYEYLPLVRIQALSQLPRGQALFQHLFVFENAPVDPTLRGSKDVLNIVDDKHRTHSNYPINAVLVPARRFHLQITYDVNRFAAPAVERMLGHFKTLLENLVRRPEARLGSLPMLTDGERDAILDRWNRTDRAYPEPRDIVARFEERAALTPSAIAVACRGDSLTYDALNARVNRLAHALRAAGIKTETLVALLGDRGIDFMVMMLGVFKAGGAYLPLDPNHPDSRLALVLKESGVKFVLAGAGYEERGRTLADRIGAAEGTQATDASGVPPSNRPAVFAPSELESLAQPAYNPARRHVPGNLAFVIFTSGSTGKPKGAMVEHRGMFNNLITKVPTLGLSETDVIAQTAGQCFDISVWQHLTALACGARTEIFADDIVRDPGQLMRQIETRGVTVLEAVPSMIQALLEMADTVELPKLRWLIACGEAFAPELCRRWMERFPHVRVLNAYGPAECSDDVSYYEAPEPPAETETLVPIGRPVDNAKLYLLDVWLTPVPVGVPGEICVAGIQVGRGYLNRPETTAEKFVPNPFAPDSSPQDDRSCESRLYRTGDLGRYREDGAIEFLGRIDHQVKIRGVRIEPGEIEAQLLLHPAVEQAVVATRDDGLPGGKRLVAYVVCKAVPADDSALSEELRAYLTAALPAYMVPAAFVRLDAMPLGGTGKIDRKALPAPDIAAQRESRYVAPRTPAEEILADIWKEVLGLQRVGVEDNFFDLGGHSLIAVQVLSRVRAAFDVEVPLRRVFEASTVARLARAVEDSLIEQLEGISDEEALALLEEEP